MVAYRLPIRLECCPFLVMLSQISFHCYQTRLKSSASIYMRFVLVFFFSFLDISFPVLKQDLTSACTCDIINCKLFVNRQGLSSSFVGSVTRTLVELQDFCFCILPIFWVPHASEKDEQDAEARANVRIHVAPCALSHLRATLEGQIALHRSNWTPMVTT